MYYRNILQNSLNCNLQAYYITDKTTSSASHPSVWVIMNYEPCTAQPHIVRNLDFLLQVSAICGSFVVRTIFMELMWKLRLKVQRFQYIIFSQAFRLVYS